MTTLYILNTSDPINSDTELYAITRLGTNEANSDRLWAVDGDLVAFESDYPDAGDYYESDNWFLNFYPDAVGDTPLEKYLNAINGVGGMNPPKWSNILPALASSSFFAKVLTTQNPNAFSALQTTVQYRNMDLFTALAKATLDAIPGGLSQEEIEELSVILAENNFPLVVVQNL